MKALRWIGFVAGRYVSRSRSNSPSQIFSILGIATGVLALTIILAVMNGFQMGFIDSILEVSSCHLRLEGLSAGKQSEINDKLRDLPGVSSVLPFREINVLLRGRQANPRGALLRGVPVNAMDLDTGLAATLNLESGVFDLGNLYSIVLGSELARHLYVRVGDDINLLSITGGIRDEEDGGSRIYTVTGIFRSGFYEFDLGWAFVNTEAVAELSSETSFTGEAAAPVLGIKLKNRWQDQKAMEEIRNALFFSGVNADVGISLMSWRDYNRAFFSALRTEKLMMFILVGLIFIVVGLNIFQAQQRTVLERREEIGLLRALGASDIAVRLIFVIDGFFIGLFGAGIGLIPGLLIAFNIPVFFQFLERMVNFFISIVNTVSDYIGGYAGAEEFSVFSPQIFYIKEIPSRVVPYEVVLIFLFGFLSALLAAWFASGKVSGTKPAEVLRYE